MNKLYYIANARIPTERAHGIQIMKMCEAFAEYTDVELVVTDRASKTKEDPFSYYGVKNSFRIKKLWCLDAVRFGKVGFRIETLSFAVSALPYLLFKKGVFYTRDEFMAFFLKLLGKKVVWEVHMGQKNLLARLIVRMGAPLVTISRGLRDLYPSASKILVAPDAVDIEKFDTDMSKEEARKILGLDTNDKLAVYTGSRLSWKGVGTLEEASKILGEVKVLIVTGKPHKEIPLYLKAADVLVIPNSAREDISRLYTSPMKLFEYMASGRPIVASDVPSIKEIVDESMVYFFVADNPRSLKSVIEDALSDEVGSTGRAQKALEKVRSYTWEKRAEKILNHIHDWYSR
ncbi:MAG: hypothetical protein A3J09_00070 [Candidatus Zambryskibacteria bacterium RIFCSPLOWO2_02_FULL_51_21]|uniref:Glycosyl transferase family 1 domain-containing protein n=1 Tax=Candidatus Zambryskibacteria bacterium RIFCSPHIGHO2_02_FULL_43_37 TaxID=1802749 RepID=A0A1G2THU0_9BACT|nr:MAG: hypothetical protein A2723_00070 [Candidatus Zambryskibacteria bacterium RIFCSPHIGHO2_01_FULL_52_18]OHA96856.1 MAG: hypothetical protein A3D49_01970 [Candidatus Zambryskibacteria bacterium RIFCSPHIGHO2_02_FULL_43_37]OHB07085.1 MAG: hypothetical protein A2944_02390 [Candidatus Zambryskibacteria bacterium RIFCSPLOWO2_01_FULL_52_12]OHB10968.1 MAG: hypothetical protein A3J09_00070 [Candidatus Zambryskibacteria bacterium RIFCSPLOWO2_02_FULL_51_21]